MRSIFTAALLGAAVMCGQGTDNKQTAKWAPVQFLFGTWVARGEGQPGAGRGESTFQPELDNHIVVRRSFAEYSTGPGAGSRHDDLVIIYTDPDGGPTRAIYFDSEGHVIHYRMTTPAPKAVVFESDGSQPGPKYRLSYVLEGEVLAGKFEIAEPGKPGYRTYLDWKSTRVREPARP